MNALIAFALTHRVLPLTSIIPTLGGGIAALDDFSVAADPDPAPVALP